MSDSGSAYKRIISTTCATVSGFRAFLYDQFKNSATNGMIERAGLRKRSIDFRRKAVMAIEKTKTAKVYSSLTSNMLSVSSRVYGTFLLTFGLYIVLVYLVKHFAFSDKGGEIADIVLSGAMILAGLPLFFVDRSFSSLLRSSRLTRYFLTKVFGIRSAMLKTCERTSNGYVTALLIGLVCGSLTIFFSPFTVLTILAVILSVMLVLASPEFGIAILFFLIPFLSNTALLFSVCVVLISLLWKVFTLKRTFHFKGLDYIVLVFGVLVLFLGMFSYRQPDGIKSALSLLTFTLSYFAVSQLVTSYDMFFCCMRSFLCGNLTIAIITLLQTLSSIEALPYVKYIVIDYNADYSIIMLMLVAFPLLLGRIGYASSKMIATFALLVVAFAIALSTPDSYWLSVLVIFFVALFAISKKGFLAVLFILFAGVAACNFFMSEEMRTMIMGMLGNVIEPYKAIFESEHIYTSNLFQGVGFGSISYRFANVSADINSVTSPISSFAYLLTSGGVITAITYIAVLLTCGVTTISAVHNGTNKRLKIVIKAMTCSMLGLLIEGVCRNHFAGDRTTLIFWLILGMLMAGNNCLEKEDTVDAYRA